MKSLQAERNAAYEMAVEQATQFVELAEAMGEIYEPGEDFTPASAYGDSLFQRTKSTVAASAPRTCAPPGSPFRGQIAESRAETGWQSPRSAP